MKMSRYDNKITYSQLATKWLDVMKMLHSNQQPKHIKQKYVSLKKIIQSNENIENPDKQMNYYIIEEIAYPSSTDTCACYLSRQAKNSVTHLWAIFSKLIWTKLNKPTNISAQTTSYVQNLGNELLKMN